MFLKDTHKVKNMKVSFTANPVDNFKALVQEAVQSNRYLDTKAKTKTERAEKVIKAFKEAINPSNKGQGATKTQIFEAKLEKLVKRDYIQKSQVNHILNDFHKARAKAKKLSSKKPQTASSSSSGKLSNSLPSDWNKHTKFSCCDFDFKKFSGKNLKELEFAVNCNPYPKLQLYIVNSNMCTSSHKVSQAINQAHHKHYKKDLSTKLKLTADMVKPFLK